MPIALNQLPDDIDALKSLVADQTTKLDNITARNEQLTTENQHYKTQVLTLQEQLNLALAKRYAASSEKISPDQVCMFDEAEADVPSIEDVEDDLILVPAHARKKRGRKPLPDNLPRVDVVHDLPESERHCDHDGRHNRNPTYGCSVAGHRINRLSCMTMIQAGVPGFRNVCWQALPGICKRMGMMVTTRLLRPMH